MGHQSMSRQIDFTQLSDDHKHVFGLPFIFKLITNRRPFMLFNGLPNVVHIVHSTRGIRISLGISFFI